MVFEPAMSAATAPMSDASPATAVMFAKLVELATVFTDVMFDATKDRLLFTTDNAIAHSITVNCAVVTSNDDGAFDATSIVTVALDYQQHQKRLHPWYNCFR